MIKVSPALSHVDITLLLSKLWDISEHCLFVDSSEKDYLACSITCFKGTNRATIGLVYTKNGGAARVFNSKMEVIGQTHEKLNQESYNGIKNMMLQMQKAIPYPPNVTVEDVLKEME